MSLRRLESHTLAFLNPTGMGTDWQLYIPDQEGGGRADSHDGHTPYSRYVFFLDIGGRGGRLETSQQHADRLGRCARHYAGMAAHEFFHPVEMSNQFGQSAGTV